MKTGDNHELTTSLKTSLTLFFIGLYNRNVYTFLTHLSPGRALAVLYVLRIIKTPVSDKVHFTPYRFYPITGRVGPALNTCNKVLKRWLENKSTSRTKTSGEGGPHRRIQKGYNR